MYTFFATIILGVVPITPLEVPVQYVEINTLYNPQNGMERFTQVIFWGQQNTAAFHVHQWVMKEKIKAIRYDPGKKYPYTLVVGLDEPERYVIIKAERVRRTETFSDPEESDRESFPLECRQKLFDK